MKRKRTRLLKNRQGTIKERQYVKELQARFGQTKRLGNFSNYYMRYWRMDLEEELGLRSYALDQFNKLTHTLRVEV